MDGANLGQYGVYEVAAILCSKGYTAVTTSRNAKAVDVLAFNPENGKSVGIQVKTGQQKKKNIKRDVILAVTTASQNIDTPEFLTPFSPFVFVYVPDIPGGQLPRPRFFVVPGDMVKQMLKDDWDEEKVKSDTKRIDDIAKKLRPRGFWVEQVEPYEDKWENLGLGPIKTTSPLTGEVR